MTGNIAREAQGQGPGVASIPVPDDILEHGLPLPAVAEGESGEPESPVVDQAAGSVLQDWPDRARFSQDVHTYLREFIRLADQKASFFFAGGTALLAFLYKNGAVGLWMKPLRQWNSIDVVAFVAAASLMLSVLLAVWVVIPRTAGSRRGTIFWEAISEYGSAREYADDVVTLSGPTLARARAEHCFDLAVVCSKKYGVLKVALTAGAVGLAASLVMFLVL
jgi:hypothetical protein